MTPESLTKALRWIVCCGLAILTLLVFWSVREHEFINYDDPDYVTDNPHVQGGLTSANIRWAFSQLHGESTYWHPVTWLSHMLDCDLFGLNAAAHHLVNVVIHSANVVLLFLLLGAMTGAFWRSAIVATLFAVHPIQVDTVAWVAERKNVLSTSFLLITLLSYTAYVRTLTLRRYLITLACYAVGLMTKPMLVTVPGILLLLDFWPLRRLTLAQDHHVIGKKPMGFPGKLLARVLVEKVPFAIMAAVSAGATILAHRQLGMEHYSHGLPLPARLANAVVSCVRYLGKVIWPQKLTLFYPHPGTWPVWAVAGCFVLLAAVSFLAVWWWRRFPFVTVGWFWFLGTLVPVLGFIQAGYQAMADRFAYVPIIGLLLIVVWGTAELLSRLMKGSGTVAAPATDPSPATIGDCFRSPAARLASIIVVIVIASCVVATSIQLRYWHSSETVWRHALLVTRNNFIAHHNLGHILVLQERYDEALEHIAEALRLRPDLIEAHYTMGVIKDQQHKYNEAIVSYEKAVEMKPDWAKAHRALLTAYYNAGQTNRAVAHLQKLVAIAPENAGGHVELAEALTAENRLPEAIKHFQDAIRAAPQWTTPQNDLAWLLATAADPAVRNGTEAVTLATRACELTRWQSPITIATLAAGYAEQGDFQKAVEMAKRARDLAAQSSNNELVARNDDSLKLYQQNKPYHQQGNPKKP